MKDALNRAARSFLQAWAVSFISLWGGSALASDTLHGLADFMIVGKIALSACFSGLFAVIVWGHNALENKGVIPTILKPNTPSGGA